MAVASITIKAINGTKAVINEVGNQLSGLDNRLKKITGVFKGLFLGGVIVGFGKKLLEASSYGKELEASAGRIKSAWSGFTTDIGDGFANIVLSLEGPIKAVGNFLESVLDNLKYAFAFIGAFSFSMDFEKAAAAAQETVDAMNKERDARKESEGVSEHQVELDTQQRELWDEIYKAQQKLADEKEKSAEADMTQLELLAKRKKQLEQEKGRLKSDVNIPGYAFNEESNKLADIEAQINIVNLEDEIKKIENGLREATEPADKKLKEGHRIIKFDRENVRKIGERAAGAIGVGGTGDLSRRAQARLDQSRANDPSWKSANYLKDINDKIDSLLALKD